MGSVPTSQSTNVTSSLMFYLRAGPVCELVGYLAALIDMDDVLSRTTLEGSKFITMILEPACGKCLLACSLAGGSSSRSLLAAGKQ